MQLATGLLYNRDLPTLHNPMRNLVDHSTSSAWTARNAEQDSPTRVGQVASAFATHSARFSDPRGSASAARAASREGVRPEYPREGRPPWSSGLGIGCGSAPAPTRTAR